MTFRIRAKAGGVYYAPNGVSFTPLRTWRSPRTGVEYPVAMRVVSGGKEYELEPLMDDRSSTRALRPGPSTGKARCGRSGEERKSGAGTWS